VKGGGSTQAERHAVTPLPCMQGCSLMQGCARTQGFASCQAQLPASCSRNCSGVGQVHICAGLCLAQTSTCPGPEQLLAHEAQLRLTRSKAAVASPSCTVR
jgi:hypothetical protein